MSMKEPVDCWPRPAAVPQQPGWVCLCVSEKVKWRTVQISHSHDNQVQVNRANICTNQLDKSGENGFIVFCQSKPFLGCHHQIFVGLYRQKRDVKKIDGVNAHFPKFVGCSFAQRKIFLCIWTVLSCYLPTALPWTCVPILAVCFSLCNVGMSKDLTHVFRGS